MKRFPAHASGCRSGVVSVWLQFGGAILAFVLIGLFAALHSQLGAEISGGESPDFAWARAHVGLLWEGGLLYLTAVFWLQHLEIRAQLRHYPPTVKLGAAIELGCILGLAVIFSDGAHALIGWLHPVLLAAIFLQAVGVLWQLGLPGKDAALRLLQGPEKRTGRFLTLLFSIGIMVALADPSPERMRAYIWLDTNVAYFLRRWLPPVSSGVTALWFGIGCLAILAGTRSLTVKLRPKSSFKAVCFFLPFFSLFGFLTAFWLAGLAHGIYWQLARLNLLTALLPLALLLTAGGSLLTATAFCRIVARISPMPTTGPLEVVTFCMGAACILPLTWRLTGGHFAGRQRMLLMSTVLAAAVFAGAAVLYGHFFNPWFTAFSYLKDAILKIIGLLAAGTLVLIFEHRLTRETSRCLNHSRQWIIVAAVFLLGFVPFAVLQKNMEVKVAVLQFSELARVDAASARHIGSILGLDRWLHYGQDPGPNGSPSPWPQPWTLQKGHPGLFPKNFNLLVIVADALRGDAFFSSGYARNLTPFLDRWARQEAVSFRRAYSQGGGTFAALPFLVAGRSRFELYGPGLYRDNLYFKIARAEGIRHYLVMKDFGPRAIFPPDFPVTELTIARAVSDRRTPTADEVFNSARWAIDQIPAGQRFLGFLHLMDVHNDLWKKKGGIDFGDTPRDLYDNNLSYLDRACGRFVKWLKKTGRYERTVIIFTADHGEQFWEHGASLHGHTLYEEEIRVPLILRVPGLSRRFDNVPVLTADMAPTVADMAGYQVDPPYRDAHMGISLVPLIMHSARRPYLKRDVVGRASFKRRYFLYRDWRWKLVYFAGLDLLQLFDVQQDPGERNNLWNEEPARAVQLEKALFDYLKKVEGKTYQPVD